MIIVSIKLRKTPKMGSGFPSKIFKLLPIKDISESFQKCRYKEVKHMVISIVIPLTSDLLLKIVIPQGQQLCGFSLFQSCFTAKGMGRIL